jgi:hypothetical protein
MAVDTDGRREIVGLGLGPSEAEPFWSGFLKSLVKRGLKGVKLVPLTRTTACVMPSLVCSAPRGKGVGCIGCATRPSMHARRVVALCVPLALDRRVEANARSRVPVVASCRSAINSLRASTTIIVFLAFRQRTQVPLKDHLP